jgi:hypothetical protein
MKHPASIIELFRTPQRFLRSTQLERDFKDPQALAGYIATPHMAAAFQRIADGLRPESGRRAWRITGDYGVGKSTFALVLAHLLEDADAPGISTIADLLGWIEAPRLWPLLVTGAREDLIGCLGRGLAESLSWRIAMGQKGLAKLRARADVVARGGCGASDLEALIADVQAAAAEQGAGVLLVIDELGKLLEHAAINPDATDVFVLQRLAEQASRSGARPLLLLGLLHQGFHAYAERLPATNRQEWDKVAGRFDEIVFDQPLSHTAALVKGALGVDTERLPKAISGAAKIAATAMGKTGWLSGDATGADVLNAEPLYPIHPTLLPPLVRFFGRYGQHERSLFGFLLSDEPFGLRSFAQRPPDAGSWYGLPEFYDYIRSNFGHRLAGRSQETHWLRVSATIDTAEDLTFAERRALKAVGVLNLLDVEDLLPTRRALSACLTPPAGVETETALTTLQDRGLLFSRGQHGGYRLWPNTSVNLRAALEQASKELPQLDGVAANVGPHLDPAPLLARRHYIESGTLRYFEVRYARPENLSSALDKPSPADGLIVVALADTPAEREAALAAAVESPFSERPEVVVGVGQPLGAHAAELLDLKHWERVQVRTPELAHDTYASSEVARMIAHASRELSNKVAARSGFRTSGEAVQWWRAGARLATPRGVQPALSDICDQLFPQAPKIANELLNRNTLSSAAAAARMRLIEGVFAADDREALGFDLKKSPPERSMYLSVLKHGGLHLQNPDGWRLVEPGKDDPLKLRPAFDEILRRIDSAAGGPVRVPDVLAPLKASPYGVRDGVAPLLLALVLKLRESEFALYEDGTFLPSWGGAEFMRLTKQPASFAIQPCRIEGIRAEVFTRLAAVFSPSTQAREAQLLDVVRRLCEFAGGLPEYVRKAGALSASAAAVRDVLLTAREPATMIFHDLPIACGQEAFAPDAETAPERASAFVAALQASIEELRTAYPRLIDRLTRHLAEAFKSVNFDREEIATRAARVSLAAREPRLRTFALRLRDPQLDNEAWLEALGAYVLSRPPKRWTGADEGMFIEQVGELAEVFHRVEATAFSATPLRPAHDAIRLNLTRGDGIDRLHVLHPAKLDAKRRHKLDLLRDELPPNAALRLQFLSELLWEELADYETPAKDGKEADSEERQRDRN